MKQNTCSVESFPLQSFPGFHRFTLSPVFRMLTVSPSLCELIGFSEKELLSGSGTLYLNRVYPPDLPAYSRFLESLDATPHTASCEYRLLHRDGSLRWVRDSATSQSDAGSSVTVFSLLTDITELKEKLANLHELSNRVPRVLSEVYDKIFEYDLDADSVCCLYSGNSPAFKMFEHITMPMEAALRQWIESAVAPEDRKPVQQFFLDFRKRRLYGNTIAPPQIAFLGISSFGEKRKYQGLFLKMSDSVSLFCCRRADTGDTAATAPAPSGSPAVEIRTFGYFDVFVDGQPIMFRNQKSMELLALLVDRRGGFVSAGEAIACLWEDESVNPLTLARYRKVALRLKNTLKSYGIADILEAVDGKRRILPERFSCDLYRYLSGQEEHSNLFKGKYLTNYSWGEETLAGLLGEFSEV